MFSGEFPRSKGQTGNDLLPVLNKFYDEVARPVETPNLDKLRAVVDRILARVKDIDGRFHFDVQDVGSLASGVSAVVACEFDILLCLDIEGEDEESDLSPGFAKFKLTEKSADMWPEARTGRYLHPKKLTDMFQGIVTQVVKSMGNDMGGEYSVGGQGAVATTVSTRLVTGFKYKADLVLAVKCHGWPSSADASWLQKGYDNMWPSRKTISAIKDDGYEMVAKYVNEFTPGVSDTGPDLELLWRLSVSRAETVLLKSIDEGGTSLCHKKVLTIFKALRLNNLVSTTETVPKDVTLPLTSYHFKTMLFHQAQLYTNPSQWTKAKLAERFCSCLYDFHRRVNDEDLPTFFFPRVNLCKNRGITHTELWNILMARLAQDPKAYITSVMPIDESKMYLYSIYNCL